MLIFKQSSNFSHVFSCMNKNLSTYFFAFLMISIASSDPDYAIRDLYNAIGNKNPPSWTMYFQVMTYEQAENCPFNPFDLTKVSTVVGSETAYIYVDTYHTFYTNYHMVFYKYYRLCSQYV